MMGLILANDGMWMRTISIKSNYDGWYYELMMWCQTYCTGEYNITPSYIAFEKNADAVFYALVHNE